MRTFKDIGINIEKMIDMIFNKSKKKLKKPK